MNRVGQPSRKIHEAAAMYRRLRMARRSPVQPFTPTTGVPIPEGRFQPLTINPTASANPSKFVPGAEADAPIEIGAHGGKQSLIEADFTQLDPYAMARVARIVYGGSRKYGKDNWRRIPVIEHLSHALMHVYAHLADDTADDHLGHALTRMMFAVAKEARPDYLGAAAESPEDEAVRCEIRFMKEARMMSKWARCNRAQCGCVLVYRGQIVAMGVNGPPGINACPDTAKHLDEIRCPNAIHAEIAAGRQVEGNEYDGGLDAYVYGHYGPCPDCREYLRGIGVNRIFYTPGEFHGNVFGYSNDTTLDLEAWYLPPMYLDGDRGDHYQFAPKRCQN